MAMKRTFGLVAAAGAGDAAGAAGAADAGAADARPPWTTTWITISGAGTIRRLMSALLRAGALPLQAPCLWRGLGRRLSDVSDDLEAHLVHPHLPLAVQQEPRAGAVGVGGDAQLG